MTNKLALSCALCAFPLSVFAADEPVTPVFQASAQLGGLYQTGNNQSSDIKAGFDLNYNVASWHNIFSFDLLVKKTEQLNEQGQTQLQTSDQKWNVNAKSNYSIDPASKKYIYATGSYENNKFGNYEAQSSVSAGWGRRLINTKVTKFDLDIGPGFKRDVTRATDLIPKQTNSGFIVQATGTYSHNLNDFVQLRQMITAKTALKSSENSQYQSETSITTKLIETLQLKFSIKIEHNTKVDPGRKKTDTETAVTLVYSF